MCCPGENIVSLLSCCGCATANGTRYEGRSYADYAECNCREAQQAHGVRRCCRPGRGGERGCSARQSQARVACAQDRRVATPSGLSKPFFFWFPYVDLLVHPLRVAVISLFAAEIRRHLPAHGKLKTYTATMATDASYDDLFASATNFQKNLTVSRHLR